ncbi:MAG TPA: hypothetical protein VLA21_06050 [Candidatus Limnocylindria bacterium]|nr:hypothetical protein [Candidatus Limnocylindria bacterium]
MNGAPALRRVISYNANDRRMGILCRYRLNISGVGVIIDFRAKTATRSLPEDLAALLRLAEGLAVE